MSGRFSNREWPVPASTKRRKQCDRCCAAQRRAETRLKLRQIVLGVTDHQVPKIIRNILTTESLMLTLSVLAPREVLNGFERLDLEIAPRIRETSGNLLLLQQ
jgi:hypothetical protein